MNDVIDLLTSSEMTIVYAVALVAFLLCMMIYIIDKGYEKRKKKHNTRELNKLVEEVEELTMEDNYKEEPVLIATEPVITPIIEEKIEEIKQEVVEPKQEVKEELEYTNTEPTKEEAQRQLLEITEQLKEEQKEENIELTDYETEQENNAIISLEELVSKSKEMYEKNELTQYADEGNEPISIKDLEEQVQRQANPEYNKPFVIEKEVKENITKEEINEMYDNKKVKLDDFNTIKVEKKFKNSPVISPVFGIEKETNPVMELENTADYDKLDQEIKKTNEFIMTLKDLQKHLD